MFAAADISLTTTSNTDIVGATTVNNLLNGHLISVERHNSAGATTNSTTNVQNTTEAQTTAAIDIVTTATKATTFITFNFSYSTGAVDFSVSHTIFGYLTDEIILVAAIAVIVLSAAVCTFVCVMKHLSRAKKFDEDSFSLASSTVNVVAISTMPAEYTAYRGNGNCASYYEV